MESIQDSNCPSLSDSFCLYERYLRSFNVVNNIVEEEHHETSVRVSSMKTMNEEYESSMSGGNIDFSTIPTKVHLKQCDSAEFEYNNLLNQQVSENIAVGERSSDIDTAKTESVCNSQAASILENSSTTADHNDKSEPLDLPVSSGDSKSERSKQPIFITSTMENSNNAVDSVPMFRDVRPSESVFKLPISELSFNGTIKHVQKLKPIVDPITALSSNNGLDALDEKSVDENSRDCLSTADSIALVSDNKNDSEYRLSTSDDQSSYDKNFIDRATESTGDSQYEEFKGKKDVANEESSSKWNSEQSYSSLEASFDSGVRSPDMFSEDDCEDEVVQAPEPFWGFIKDFELHDKKKVKKIEHVLQGVLPPPSVTILKTDVTEMLKKYYCFLPAFTSDEKINTLEVNSVTPTKKVSFVHIPTDFDSSDRDQEVADTSISVDKPNSSKYISKSAAELDISVNDKTIDLKLCTQIEATETPWPEVVKCRYYDVYYNITKYSEKYECLALRYGERFVGAETDTSVSIHSGGLQSPSSAVKRKALRLAQAKSPGRRLSHLARRRQTFCSAATINEKAQSSSSKMVLIDKNFFPHRKLINTSERRSPRKQGFRRTPGKKTPGKKTPAKTPKTRSGGSSRKKTMRRLLIESEGSRSQPTRETLKRALFVSPENRKKVPPAPCSSVPLAMKSRRALFGSPVTADTKSCDGSESDQFLKRKRDSFDDLSQNVRSKIAKSLSFGGDRVGTSQSHSMHRRASEVLITKNMAELNENHKQKLLWAVSVALRIHGWGMSSPGFREKASALARLTRKLMTLPPHAARLAAPNLSTSDTMLKLARLYVYAIIKGRSVEECFEDEKTKLANEANSKVTGYISASAYQQLKAKQAVASTSTSQIKENTCTDGFIKQEQPRSSSKNILQDKLVNIDSNSNSSSGLGILEKNSLSMFKSNSMPSFEEAAKMRARRQISFDNIDFPKR